MKGRRTYVKSCFSRARVSKYSPDICVHPTKPVDNLMFVANTPTRQQARARAREIEYAKLGVGTHGRPVFDLPRRALRAIARAIVQRQWREQRALTATYSIKVKKSVR